MFIANDQPDMMLITEVIPKSQVNPIAPALLDIEGYNCHMNFDPNSSNLGRSGIRGVAIYSRKTIQVNKVDISVKGQDDHIWVEIPTQSGENVLCGCIYRTQSNDVDLASCTQSTNEIRQLIIKAYEYNSNLIIAGDFNFKNIEWDNQYVSNGHKHLLDFIDTLQDCFLHQHVTEPTRYRENEASNLLDLILTSEEGMVHNLNYHPPLGESDHVCLTFTLFYCQQDYQFQPEYNVFKTNYEALKEILSKHDWTTRLNANFQSDYSTFMDILTKAFEGNSALTTPPKKRKNLYMTRESSRLKNTKARLWKKYILTRSQFDRDKYIKCKNKLRSLTRNLRSDFEKNLVGSIKETPKSFWKYAKTRLKTRSSIPTLDKPDGSKAVSAIDKANALNQYFNSIFTIENIDSLPSASFEFKGEILTNITISPDLVLTKLKLLNPNKSPGPDRWHPHFLRELADVIYIPLSILFNKSLEEGTHKSWLNAIITAIHKKGSKKTLGNYRPVSLTSVISKIMESIVRDSIVLHMTQNHLFSDAQHGFVPGRNCITQLLLCMEEWTSLLERGDAFDVVYTDFAKAFDSVPHQRLMVKLKNIGISGKVLNWIDSFLTGRKQCVSIEGKKSKWEPVFCGIPQGSVIGPILFVIFINDMPNEVKYNMCKLFADDCKLYGVVNVSDKASTIQKDLDNLSNWSIKWQLPFNATKCKTIHFGYQNPELEYKLNGHILDKVHEEKDLGVIIDDELKFHQHTASVSKKANQILGVIKRSFNTRDPRTISTLYKSMVRPHLEYGNAIWGPHFQADIIKVESVQRRATKLIHNLKDKPYQERLRILELPSLLYRRKRGDMILMYKIVKGLVRLESKELFTVWEESRTRGHNHKIFKEHAAKLPRKNNFSQRSVNDWNSLPIDVVNAPSIDAFKNRLDKFWSKHHYDIPF